MNNGSEHNRTIESVTNLDTGKTIYANDFFNENENIIWNYREKCQDAIQGKRPPFLVCDTCGQLIQISGGKGVNGKITYFKHLKDSNYCPIKTDTKLSKPEILRGKFNGQKEGYLHIETKKIITQFLTFNKIENKGISLVEVEKINRNVRNYFEWKKPDITSIFFNKNLVFEIQLSTTFLDVICERQHFYRENKIFILWVFRNFEIESDKQRFTQKDVFYSNNRNAFIIDEEAIKLSENNRDLYLLCQYQKPILDREELIYNWESKYIRLSDLTFDEITYKVYYFDVTREENKVNAEINNRINEKKEKERERIREYEKNIQAQEIKKRKKLIEAEYHSNSERHRLIDEGHYKFKIKNAEFFIRLNQYENLSPLQNIFYSNIYEFFLQLSELFSKGYNLSNSDIEFLKIEFYLEKRNYKNTGKFSVLYFISLAIFFHKIRKQPEYFKVISKIERVLIAILSIKEKIVIGYNYQNIVQIPHQFIGNKLNEEFTVPILAAIRKYYGYEEFINEHDAKRTLDKKIILLNRNIPQIRNEYKVVINLIFKDLIP